MSSISSDLHLIDPNPPLDLVAAIRERVITGAFAPGQRLKEEWLASEFGVSRIPLREALRALESEGFIRSERYSGTFVATLDAEAAHDLLDVRAVLEPLAAAQAAIRHTPGDLETFRRLLDEGDRAFRERRYDGTRRAKAAFYEHLAVASHNATLVEVMRTVRFKIEWATSIDAISRTAEEYRKRRAKTYREIVDAIAARDPARAATAVAAVIDDTYASQGWRPVVDVQFEGNPAGVGQPA